MFTDRLLNRPSSLSLPVYNPFDWFFPRFSPKESPTFIRCRTVTSIDYPHIKYPYISTVLVVWLVKYRHVKYYSFNIELFTFIYLYLFFPNHKFDFFKSSSLSESIIVSMVGHLFTWECIFVSRRDTLRTSPLV